MPGPSLATRLRGALSRIVNHPRVGRFLRSVLNNRLRHRGRLIDTSSPHVSDPTVARLFWGLYEARETRLVQRYLRRDLDVVELGASIGVISAHIAHRLATNRRLLCVEANPQLLPLIERNVALNTTGCTLVTLSGAIDYSGQPSVRLKIAPNNVDSRLTREATGLEVATTTLSRLIAKFALESFTLVADIEGSELGLILQDAAALSHVQQLIIELHAVEHQGQVWSPERMRAELVATHGFRLRATLAKVSVFDRAA